MSEWLKEHAWKACVGETLPWVRIPLSPPTFVLNFQEVAVSKNVQRAIAFCSRPKAPCDPCNKGQNQRDFLQRVVHFSKPTHGRWPLTVVLRLAPRQRGQRVDCRETVGFTSRPLASEPIPLWCELLNERTRKRNVAAPTLPDRNRSTGIRRGILCIFKELEARCSAR